MVYVGKEIEIKRVMLKALENCTNINNGLGYNVLFDRVRQHIGSRSTFHKYLGEMIKDGYVERKPDPRHKKGVVIYRREEPSRLYESFLKFMQSLKKAIERERVKPVELILYDFLISRGLQDIEVSSDTKDFNRFVNNIGVLTLFVFSRDIEADEDGRWLAEYFSILTAKLYNIIKERLKQVEKTLDKLYPEETLQIRDAWNGFMAEEM